MLAMILNWLGGGVLTSVLGHLEKRAAIENDREKLKTEVTISEIKAELATRQEQAQIVKLQLGHPVAWVPRFLAEMTAVVYFLSIVVDSIWNLDGTVAALPVAEAGLMATIFAGMFLTATFRK
ncbi:MAG: hypothetical protein RJA36_309 [Pseudomonadota bacterium]|jgi:hypothetical protein